jgi:hypothetical protein
MAMKHHLVKRGSAWYFRRRVPKHLVATFKTAFIQFSLGTTNLRKAASLREVHDVEWTRKFTEAEAAQKPANEKSEQSTPSILTQARAIERVRAYVEKVDEHRRKDALSIDPLDRDDRDEWEKDLELELAIAQGRAAHSHEAVFDLVKRAAMRDRLFLNGLLASGVLASKAASRRKTSERRRSGPRCRQA